MRNIIIGICVGLIVLAIIFFVVYLKKMLNGKCCESCKSCNQKNNCINFVEEKTKK